jgi:prepilin-type N-terminal cleavage/methylation domain-containing protein
MIKMQQRIHRNEGFTLIELLIVIVVLGILAGIVLFAVGSARDDAEGAASQADIKICKTALAAAIADKDSGADDVITDDEIDEYTDGDVCDENGVPK